MSIAEDIDKIDDEVWHIYIDLTEVIDDLENIYDERFADVEARLDGIRHALVTLRANAERVRSQLDKIVDKYEE